MLTTLRRAALPLALALLTAAAPSLAQLDAHGVGGGGFLTAGAIHPINTDTAVIGGDVCGVFRTDDFGLTWEPWMKGLTNPDDSPSSYVDDLVGVSYNGWGGFYAATRGGIFRSTLDGDWEWMTPPPPSGFHAYKPQGTGFANRADVVPFSTLDWDGANLLVAGAGQIRWRPGFNYPDETQNYPGLPGLDPIPGGLAQQYSVWKLDLDQSLLWWVPDTDPGAPTGAVRDISVAQVNGSTVIAVATANGIYLKVDSVWTDLGNLGGFPTDPCPDRAWSVHATERGDLYAAFNYNNSGELDCLSGVYQIDDVFNPLQWVHVGGHPGSGLPPSNEDMRTIGSDTELIYLSVGEGPTEDHLYLGGRLGAQNLNVGLYTTTIAVGGPVYHATWQHAVYRDQSANFFPVGFDSGWDDANPRVLFEPAVCRTQPQKALAQFHTWMHTTQDAGTNWDQRYTQELAGTYKSRGYNELVVWGLDLSGSNLVTGTADYGVFRASSGALDYFERLETPVPSSGTPSCDEAWQHGALYAHAITDWRGSGEEILIVSGANRTYDSPGKLFWVDPNDGWHGITCDIPDADRYVFHDFYVGPGFIYAAYEKHNAQVSATSNVVETGILKGQQLQYPCGGCIVPSTDPGTWIWSTDNTGLPADDSQQPLTILRNEDSQTYFMIARVATGDGALYFAGENGWQQLLPTANGSLSGYRDFWSIAQAADGSVIYVGTNGNSNGKGAVLKFDIASQPDPLDPETWVPIELSDGDSFGFVRPFYRTNSAYGVPSWSDDTVAGENLTWIRALAVDPGDPDIVYAGLHSFGTFAQEGVWRFNGGWDQLPEGDPVAEDPMQGIGVFSLCISSANSGQLVVGTQGHELYTIAIPSSAPFPQSEAELLGSGPVAIDDSKTRLQMLGPRPNPGPGSTYIYFRSATKDVEVSIYDVAGRRVTRMQVEASVNEPTGVLWAGTDLRGERVPNGIYYAMVRAGGEERTSRVVLMR